MQVYFSESSVFLHAKFLKQRNIGERKKFPNKRVDDRCRRGEEGKKNMAA